MGKYGYYFSWVLCIIKKLLLVVISLQCLLYFTFLPLFSSMKLVYTFLGKLYNAMVDIIAHAQSVPYVAPPSLPAPRIRDPALPLS